MNKKRGRKPDLHFSPSGTTEGFTPAGVQGFDDLDPAAIVRELIQNSLDAVRGDGRSKAIVHFALEDRALTAVPAIGTYRSTVEKAVRAQKRKLGGQLPEQAQMVVAGIEKCLSERTVSVLSVLDNGLGLDRQRMDALLGDGVSMKSSDASGAFGNGHLTAFPASELRYVLYGGVCASGKKIASGHAILASFSENDVCMGKDGIYALSVSTSMYNRYEFPSGNHMARLIREKLNWIEENSDSKKGAVVIIPGFNKFGEEDDLWSVIERAVACNFFVAIEDGDLEITYQDDDGEKKLNESNMGRVFSGDIASEKRAKRFLSGSRAAEAYRTLVKGKVHEVDVGCGTVKIVLREIHEGRSRIDLCRNGMWISESTTANRLPRLSIDQFSNRKPFHCLIKVTSENGGIHDLIRKSEGPLHNHVIVKKLQPKDRKDLRNAFQKIADFLLKNVEEQPNEVPTDVLDVEKIIYGEKPRRKLPVNGGNGPKPPVPNGPGGNGDPPLPPPPFAGRVVRFEAVAVPVGVRSYSVELRLMGKLKANTGVEIRFVLDENRDETCDYGSDHEFARLKAGSVRMNGEEVAGDELVRNDDGEILGVRLEDFKSGEMHRVDFDYDLPYGAPIQATDKVVLQAKIMQPFSRREQTQEQSE